MGGGGGSGSGGGSARNDRWLPDGIMAFGIARNPDYAKLAADSIAKEMQERGLTAAARPATTPAPAATSANQPEGGTTASANPPSAARR
jgi:hypothetical protein